jgi:hypothetical protein
MMRLHRHSATLLVATLASAGCGAGSLAPVCTDQANAGIVLTLEDSTTGARYPFTDVVAVANDGAFRDTTRIASITDRSGPSGFGLAHERPGVYDVTVRAAGYAPWTTRGVRVDEEKVCHHVITRSLTARLRPLGT